MAANMINLKVFLRNENSSEARRFTVDTSIATCFLLMKEKLLTVFPLLQNRDFKITWKDADGDDISIANDEDFIIAFTEMSGNVKVLYVTVIKDNKDPIFAMDAEVQGASRVICDNCNQAITGFRYKCVQCPDYDLCAGCERQEHHSKHMMIRVPNSEVFIPRYALKVMHNFAYGLKKAACVASKEAFRAAKYATKLAAAAAATAPEDEKTNQPQPGTSTQKPEERQKCPFNLPEEINVDNFQALGAMARQHLEPLLDTLGALQNRPEDDSKTTNQKEQGQLLVDVIQNAIDGFFGNITNQQVPQNKTTEATTPPKDSSTHNSQSDFVPMDVEIPTNNGPHVTPASTPQHSESPILQQSENGRHYPGWTFVATNQSQTNQNIENENSQNAQAAASAFVYHENPKIAEGIVQLYEMGFSNDNGILTRLLERFNGNVPKVVKALIEMQM